MTAGVFLAAFCRFTHNSTNVSSTKPKLRSWSAPLFAPGSAFDRARECSACFHQIPGFTGPARRALKLTPPSSFE